MFPQSTQHSTQHRVPLIQAVRRANLQNGARARAESLEARAESLEGGPHLPVLIRRAVAREEREAREIDAVLLLLHLHGANLARVRVHQVVVAAVVAAATVGTREADQTDQEDITGPAV